jgi:hypothetical protein
VSAILDGKEVAWPARAEIGYDEQELLAARVARDLPGALTRPVLEQLTMRILTSRP